jgi:hypothetical protein
MMRNVPANAMFFPGKPHDNYSSPLPLPLTHI